MTEKQLLFVGIGGIMGAGFFLGCGLPIRTAGPAVLLAFVLGGLITAQVVGALTSVAADHPEKGAFKAYADKYIGPYSGFLVGWIYYLSSLITVASEAVAMSIFTQLWLPSIPAWILTSIYTLIVILINAFGVRNFSRIESLMSIVKMAALAGFIVFALISLVSLAFGSSVAPAVHTVGVTKIQGFFPHGFGGVLQSMLIVIFAYAGVGVFATAASELRDPKKLDKGAIWTVTLLTALYVVSIGMLLWLMPWSQISTKASPFVVALQSSGIPIAGPVFNAVILIASFSVMAGAVFSANQILYNLGETCEAPKFVNKKLANGTAIGALISTTICITVILVISYLLPANVYSFLISSSSFFTFFTWIVILWTFVKWRRVADHGYVSKLSFGEPISTILTMVVIFILTGYALLQRDQRLGFYASLIVILLTSAVYWIFIKEKQTSTNEWL